MGMGYAANLVYVVEGKQIESVCGPLYRDLLATMAEAGIDLGELALAIYNDDAIDHNVDLSYKTVCYNFKVATGMDLWLDYHDSDECGDRYDAVDGAFWSVDGVEEKTPQAKDFEAKFGNIDQRQFVTFG
jgi:hypothetical protein